MSIQGKRWQVVGNLPKSKKQGQVQEIVNALLKNRGIKSKKEKEEFFNPSPPEKISVKSLSLSSSEIRKAIARIKKAKKDGEKVIIYGDYDADGVTGTAILWECLSSAGIDVFPYIPERFSEGYGLKTESLEKVKAQNPNVKLIITVDNGIVANEAIDVANELGIDVIVTDHHLPRINAPRGREAGRRWREANSVRAEIEYPNAQAIIHTTKIGGAAVAWILAREINKKLQTSKIPKLQSSLDLCAIGTIADQLPLIGPNRSFVKYGLQELNRTQRPGLLSLFEQAGIKKGRIGAYTVGFVIAPRINAMGRLKHAIDSLRLLCTQDEDKSRELALHLGETNAERQRIVEKVFLHAKESAQGVASEGLILIAHETYHEGVIGLAASKLVEEFYRPAIVLSRGKKYSKASARSIPGFNIIEAIKKFEGMLLTSGGHPMAAGFTIETSKIDEFYRKLHQASVSSLTEEVLTKTLKVDLELDFSLLNQQLAKAISSFEPTGTGNPTPSFLTKNVNVVSARVVGRDNAHLKLLFESKGLIFDAIGFGLGKYLTKISPDKPVDVVYNLEENYWNGNVRLQLKVKDIKI
jgi:single-stranded-DNA-specific exonuclease